MGGFRDEFVHMSAGDHRGHWCGIPLEQILHAVVTCLTWMLGPKIQSPVRAVSSLNCCAISLAPNTILLRTFLFVCFVFPFIFTQFTETDPFVIWGHLNLKFAKIDRILLCLLLAQDES